MVNICDNVNAKIPRTKYEILQCVVSRITKINTTPPETFEDFLNKEEIEDMVVLLEDDLAGIGSISFLSNTSCDRIKVVKRTSLIFDYLCDSYEADRRRGGETEELYGEKQGRRRLPQDQVRRDIAGGDRVLAAFQEAVLVAGLHRQEGRVHVSDTQEAPSRQNQFLRG